jgi:hypothetical protein
MMFSNGKKCGTHTFYIESVTKTHQKKYDKQGRKYAETRYFANSPIACTKLDFDQCGNVLNIYRRESMDSLEMYLAEESKFSYGGLKEKNYAWRLFHNVYPPPSVLGTMVKKPKLL